MRLTCNTIRAEAEFKLQRDVSEGEIYLEDMEEPLENTHKSITTPQAMMRVMP